MQMKKLLTFFAAALISVGAFADSYTLTFKTNGTADSTKVIKPTEEVANVVDQGANYVSGFRIGPGGGTSTTTTGAYLGKDGYGLKFGTSSRGANLVIGMNALGAVNADSIVVSACAWENAKGGYDTPNAVINGQAITIPADGTFRNYSVAIGSKLDSIYVSNSAKGRFYVNSITVYYAQGNSFDPAIAHSPRYAAGKTYEYLLGPDMVDETKTRGGETKKGIADIYQWIVYTNPTGTLDDGTAEVATSNRWTNINPAEENDTTSTWIQVKGQYNNAGSVNSPCLDFQDYGKYITFYVKDTKKFVAFAAGSASSKADNLEYIKVSAVSADGTSLVEGQSTPGKIYGKGTSSDYCSIELDPTKAYEITIKDACDADHSAGKATVMLTGIQLWGTDTIPGVGVHSAKMDDYSYWETVAGPDMVTTYVSSADGKTYYRTNFEGVKYNNPTDTDNDGYIQVQTSNRWTDLNPTTHEKGTWIQVKGNNGSVNAPVITKKWNKSIEFNVTGAKIFRVFATGSSSSKANDNNAVYLTVTPFNNNGGVFTTNSTPGKIYGKGSSSDSVSVVLNPNERYNILVETGVDLPSGKDPDIMITGINLQNEEGVEQQAQNLGTLNRTIAAAVAANQDTLELAAGQSYSLNGEAPVAKMTIVGNGATIVTDSLGQLTATRSLVVENAKFNCANSTVAPIALSATPDSATYTYGTQYGDTIYYTQAEADSINALGGDSVSVNDIKTITKAYKYAGANQKVFEADLISLKNCEFNDLATSLVTGNKQPYALLKLDIDGSKVFQAYKSGDPTINWYGGPNSIKDINIVNSTFVNDSTNNNVYFLRYSNASNARPKKVYGTNGTASWVMKNNTLVNMSATQNFANNYVSDPTDTLTWTGNVFDNCYRLNKAAGNCVKNFTNADNTIKKGVKSIDSNDLKSYATEDSLMFNPANKAHNYTLSEFSLSAKNQFGAPEWLVAYATDTIPSGKEIGNYIANYQAYVSDEGKFYLVPDGKYTINQSIVAPRSLSLEGDATAAATIDASGLAEPFVVLDTLAGDTTISSYYRVDSIHVANVSVKNLKNSIIWDNNIQKCVVDLTIDNSVLQLATEAVKNEALVSFQKGGVKDFTIKNSTVYGVDSVAKYFIRYNNGARLDRYGFDKTTETQSMNYLDNTFYGVLSLSGAQWGNYNGISGQAYSKFDVENNIWYNCGKDIVRRMAGGRFGSGVDTTFVNNTYFNDSVDISASEASYDASGTILTSDPEFKDAAAGDFTIGETTLQALYQTGDPRWRVPYATPVPAFGEVTYALVAGDTFTSGQIVDVTVDEDVVATIQYGEAGGADFAEAKADGNAPEGYTASTGGNGTNGNKAGGTFYTIVPKYDGVIEAAIILNPGKSFHLTVDGVQNETFDGNTVAEKFYGNFKFNVAAGKSYKFWVDGSKLGFYGFNYKYGTDVEPINEQSLGAIATGIDSISDNSNKLDLNAPMYNVSGQRVGKSYRGIVIQNGKKYMLK